MNSTKKIITSAMLAALTFVATIVIKIPSPVGGYLNLGDAIVLLSGAMLPPLYAFLAAGIGSALADAAFGYFIYIPATFLIKGLMALLISSISKPSVSRPPFPKFIGGIVAEIIMVSGYYIFEGFLYGFGPSMINIFPNAIQGTVGFIIGMILIKILRKYTDLRHR